MESPWAVIDAALGEGSAETTVVPATGRLFGNIIDLSFTAYNISYPLDYAILIDDPSFAIPVIILLEDDYDEKFCWNDPYIFIFNFDCGPVKAEESLLTRKGCYLCFVWIALLIFPSKVLSFFISENGKP